jgi:preprotein translocase subunit SecE
MATKENQKEAEEGGTPRDDAEEASADESRPEEDASGAEEKGSEEETGEDESAPAAGTLGAARYVMTGFFLAMIAGAYVLGRTLGAIWGKLAEAIWFQKSLAALARVGEEERSEISVAIGAAVALGVGVRPDVRQWTDEVASEMSKVTWPDKSEVTNSTIIVIVTSAFATLYLALLDRFWGFVTNLVYGS